MFFLCNTFSFSGTIIALLPADILLPTGEQGPRKSNSHLRRPDAHVKELSKLPTKITAKDIYTGDALLPAHTPSRLLKIQDNSKDLMRDETLTTSFSNNDM